MGLDIIPGRNSGYPCITELPELPESADCTPPLPDMLMKLIPGSNGGYPFCTETFSPETVLSELFSGEHGVTRLYFGDRPVREAYFNGECVYRMSGTTRT